MERMSKYERLHILDAEPRERTSPYVVESGVPVPRRRFHSARHPMLDAIEALRVGQSFKFPAEQIPSARNRAAHIRSLYPSERRRYEVRPLPDEPGWARLWRVR